MSAVLDRVQPYTTALDAGHRRPVTVRPVSHLFAARWEQFERIATELMEDYDAEHYTRAAGIYEQWAQRYAELNDPGQARECHSIAVALRQRVELIRRYPGEFSDVMAVLADIFNEQQAI